MSKKVSKIPFTEIQWVINNLPPKDMEKIDKMEIDLVMIDNFMTQEIENGAQFSFKYDTYSECPQVSIMYLERGQHHTGYAMSARGKDFSHCLAILMYKFFEVAKGDMTTLSESKQGRPKYG